VLPLLEELVLLVVPPLLLVVPLLLLELELVEVPMPASSPADPEEEVVVLAVELASPSVEGEPVPDAQAL
jgi:hypothetical protein